jgi:hypothetical protein
MACTSAVDHDLILVSELGRAAQAIAAHYKHEVQRNSLLLSISISPP